MNIIELAKEAGFYVTDDDILMPEWKKLADLVRAEALEEAAKVCDAYIDRLHEMRDNDKSLPEYQPELAGRQAGAGRCAAAIRGLK